MDEKVVYIRWDILPVDWEMSIKCIHLKMVRIRNVAETNERVIWLLISSREVPSKLYSSLDSSLFFKYGNVVAFCLRKIQWVSKLVKCSILIMLYFLAKWFINPLFYTIETTYDTKGKTEHTITKLFIVLFSLYIYNLSVWSFRTLLYLNS